VSHHSTWSRRFLPVLGSFLGFLCCALAVPNAFAAPGPEDSPFTITHIRLDVRVDVRAMTLDGVASLSVTVRRPTRTLSLDAVEFAVHNVRLQKETGAIESLSFQYDGRRLRIDLPGVWTSAQKGVVVIAYRVHRPKKGLQFFGPSPDEPDCPPIAWACGEPDRNSYWFPCIEHPSVKQSTELLVTVDEGFEAVSNGRLVERRTDRAKRTVMFHWLQEKPQSAYLVALVVGTFDIERDEGKGVPLLYYVPKGRRAEIRPTFGRTREVLDFFSRRFGIPYPWDKYAQVCVAHYPGGLETTSATCLSPSMLRPVVFPGEDTPDGVIVHELAHQWWGDLVTCRDWPDIWLNEGFAAYCELLWLEHEKGPGDYASAMFELAEGAISACKDRPLVDRTAREPLSSFGPAYVRGPWILHLLRKRLGEELFWKGLQKYGREYRFRCADTNDFRRILERESGRDLGEFFHEWTERPGNPVLRVKIGYRPETKAGTVHVSQVQSGKLFHLPLTVTFRCNGSDHPISIRRRLVEREQEWAASLPSRPTTVEVDPEQALLVELHEEKDPELWLSQLRLPCSVASRLRAVEHFGQSRRAEDQAALAHAFTNEKVRGVQEKIASNLSVVGGTTSRAALIHGLGAAYVPKVRRACVWQLGSFTGDRRAADGIKTLIDKVDESDFVRAAALQVYGRLRMADSVTFVSAWLSHSPPNHVLRAESLTGLGESGDFSALPTLRAWTARDKPAACRESALRALSRLTKTATPTAQQRREAVSVLASSLDDPASWIRRTAVECLNRQGSAASGALEKLDAVTQSDPDPQIRDQARKAAERIRNEVREHRHQQ
jgi:aminopeptidase N